MDSSQTPSLPPPPPLDSLEPAPKKPKMSTTASSDDDLEDPQTLTETLTSTLKPPRYKRRKVAIFFAYCGVGYQGMQKNPGAKTIESDLEEALYLSGAIPDSDRGCPRRFDWARSARTDKGVSAVGQVVSGRFYVDPPGFVERLNGNLCEQIRVFGYKRVTPGFNAKKFCDRRRYVYLLPVFALDGRRHRDRGSVLASLGSGEELVKCLECSERGRKVLGVMGSKEKPWNDKRDLDSKSETLEEKDVSVGNEEKPCNDERNMDSKTGTLGEKDGSVGNEEELCNDEMNMDSKNEALEENEEKPCNDGGNDLGVMGNERNGEPKDESLEEKDVCVGNEEKSCNDGVSVMGVMSDDKRNIDSGNGSVLSIQSDVSVENGEKQCNDEMNVDSKAETLGEKEAEVVQCDVSSLENEKPCSDGGVVETLKEKKSESEFKYVDEVKERFNRILKYYEGTHNFHNFTTRTKAEDPAAKRYIVSFEANTTLTVEGIEFIKCEVVGQSFMLHQIRKMMGLAVSVMRGFAPESIYETAFDQDVNINVPTAPEVGLYLDECLFTSYNNKWKDSHEELSMKDYAEEAEEFKLKYIYSHIANTEHKEGAVALWLHSLNHRNYPDLRPAVPPVETNSTGGEAIAKEDATA